MQLKKFKLKLKNFFELLRWNKPTGRMILLIPAGWSLYLTPGSNPSIYMLLKIIFGGLLVSGLGCVANDIWDNVHEGMRDAISSKNGTGRKADINFNKRKIFTATS